ncbi:hypothetical protein A3A84_00350 [Candidatus Collierbacteria bacterium RIFCSPLOWO2_01_FULL_50_23]|uniref:Uncharacterized protein n=2 Tax=Candidatus Collieribacteriota TaxID=1752725 RepID=A0A1F5ES59_9BACT|nr:MAG: hypothetical protein A3D09_03455 [Candidatus Collierbacteria bacterium RIFCSPHIGHO2_02_FULL_49_10]OGD71404.1 MAG: hypothetical protein A2703_04020 [Candidatus Collierbacteria bacterium RIFCSPHIGHO2_01_FULL_50_25]OGD74082.1 MAG: hypothetical protein A3A84_00350 [Candidatus Collierbacteria bacterium RIFCSPLOWO2_01_FULL_50_23]
MFSEYTNEMARNKRGDIPVARGSYREQSADVHQPAQVIKGLWKNRHLVFNTGQTWWKTGRIPDSKNSVMRG